MGSKEETHLSLSVFPIEHLLTDCVCIFSLIILSLPVFVARLKFSAERLCWTEKTNSDTIFLYHCPAINRLSCVDVHLSVGFSVEVLLLVLNTSANHRHFLIGTAFTEHP